MPPGPYVVLPLFGPSTVRDTAALPVDFKGDLVRQFDPTATRNEMYGLRVVDTRANLLGASRVLEDVALDPYTFVRDAYLQRRRAEIREGDPPELPSDDESKE